MSYRLLVSIVLLARFLPTTAMSHGRYAFSGILSRPSGSWPGGKRLAVYVKISIEDFPFGVGGPALVPGLPMPDVMNYAWRDYGNRVGIYRLLDDLDRLGIPAAFATNTMVYDTCPGLMDTIRASGRHEVRLLSLFVITHLRSM
jgi:allantoinase